MAVTAEGKGMQTYSLPLTPWVQARLGVPSCLGHPVMKTEFREVTAVGWLSGKLLQKAF